MHYILMLVSCCIKLIYSQIWDPMLILVLSHVHPYALSYLLQIVIMLVDSQGTGDNRKSDVNLDTLIMYISLQLATVQALNIKSYLTSNDMFSLKVSCLLHYNN